MKKYLFGVDVGGTTVKNGIFTTEGELLYKWEIPTRKENKGEAITKDIAESCKAVAQEQGYPYEEFCGMGIGIPGPVNKEGVVFGCVNIGWGDKALKAEMEALTGLHVEVANDANVAALGEAWQGAGKGCSDMVMVTLGTGVGGGVIVNGKLVAGAHGYGAEVGHMVIDLEDKDRRCNCGKHGCYELYCSATGIAYEAKKALKNTEMDSALRQLEEITAKDVFDAAKASDAFAISQVEIFGKRMAQGLSYIAGTVDPEAFVIGGGVSKAGNIIPEVIKRYYGEFVFGRQNDVKILIAELGNDAGIYGAAKLVL